MKYRTVHFIPNLDSGLMCITDKDGGVDSELLATHVSSEVTCPDSIQLMDSAVPGWNRSGNDKTKEDS